MEIPPDSGAAQRLTLRVDSGLAMLEKFLLAWAVILMAVNTIGNVIARVGFDSSLFFSEELNQFLIVLITFVGTSAAARQGRHIRMSALTDMLPESKRRLALVFIHTGTAAVVGLLAWYAASYILRVRGLGQVTPAMQIPVWMTLLWLPLGLGIAALQFLLTAWVNLRTRSAVYLGPRVRESDQIDIPTV